jgi:hypothetical protein
MLRPLQAPWLPKLPNYERLQFVRPRGDYNNNNNNNNNNNIY